MFVRTDSGPSLRLRNVSNAFTLQPSTKSALTHTCWQKRVHSLKVHPGSQRKHCSPARTVRLAIREARHCGPQSLRHHAQLQSADNRSQLSTAETPEIHQEDADRQSAFWSGRAFSSLAAVQRIACITLAAVALAAPTDGAVASTADRLMQEPISHAAASTSQAEAPTPLSALSTAPSVKASTKQGSWIERLPLQAKRDWPPDRSKTFLAASTAVAGVAGCVAAVKYRGRRSHQRRRDSGRGGDPGVQRLMGGFVRCLDALPEQMRARFAALVKQRVVGDTREGEASAAVSILVGLLDSKSELVQQIAANGLIEAVCGLPAWTEMTVINRETMRRAGAATPLVRLLTSAPEPLQIAAYTLTAGFARDDSTARQLYAAGIITPAMAALRSPVAYIQAVAVEIIDWVAQGEGRQALVEVGVVPMLVGLLASPSQAVRQSAAAAVRSVASCSPNNVAAVVRHGGIPPLVHLLASEEQEVQHAALLAIDALCLDLGNLRQVARAGAIPLLIRLVESPHSCDAVRGGAAAFVQGLASDELGERDALVQGGAVGALVAGLRSGCEGVRRAVLGGMANISCSADSASRFLEAGSLPMLAGMLDARSDQEQLLASMTLSNLAYLGLPSSAVEEVDLLPRLIRLLQRGQDTPEELLVKAAATMANLGKHGTTSTDAVWPLLDLLKMQSGRVQQHATLALKCCSHNNAAIQAKIVEAGGVGVLLGILCEADWSDVTGNAAGALMNLANIPASRPKFKAAFANLVIIRRTEEQVYA